MLVFAATACVSGAPHGAPPIMRIDGPAMLEVQPGAPVRLTGSGIDPDGGPVSPTWDMGDGTVSDDVTTVVHRYSAPGVYRVALGGNGPNGAFATPAEVSVQVGVLPAGGNTALRFGGSGRDDVDRVKILIDDPSGQRTFGADVATDMTIEFWLRARPGDNEAAAVKCGDADVWIYGNVVLDRDRFDQGRKFGMSIADGIVVFGLTGNDGPAVSMCGRTRIDDDRWHHVAVTRSEESGTLRLFVDGVPEAEVPAGPPGDVSYPDGALPRSKCDDGERQPCSRSDPYLVIGAEKHDAGPKYPSFRGVIDELRLSVTVRYAGSFPPPRRQFEPDPSTAALYHFDEGRGSVVIDSAGTATRSDGVVRAGSEGPEWVASDAPTGS